MTDGKWIGNSQIPIQKNPYGVELKEVLMGRGWQIRDEHGKAGWMSRKSDRNPVFEGWDSAFSDARMLAALRTSGYVMPLDVKTELTTGSNSKS